MPASYILPFSELRLKNVRNLTIRQSPARIFAIEGEFALASIADVYHRGLRFPIVERQNNVLTLVECSASFDRPVPEAILEGEEPLPITLGFRERYDAPTARYMIHVLVRSSFI